MAAADEKLLTALAAVAQPHSRDEKLHATHLGQFGSRKLAVADEKLLKVLAAVDQMLESSAHAAGAVVPDAN